MVIWDDEQQQAGRAQALSLMLPWREFAEEFCAGTGMSPHELEDAPDEVLIPRLSEGGFSVDAFIATFSQIAEMTGVEGVGATFDMLELQRWMAENLRRAAREEDALPLGIAVGGVIVDTSAGEENPVVIATASRFTDPDAIAQKFLRTCRLVFGREPFKDVTQRPSRSGKKRRLTPEQMVAMRERGMSYKEIAIQSLRDECPGIIEDPDAFRPEIKTERARIIKVIAAAQRLWNPRMSQSSTP